MASRSLRTCVFVVISLSLCACVFGQEGQRSKPYEPRKVVLSPQPVTRDEAAKIFAKVNQAMSKVLPGIRISSAKLTGPNPVTRQEIVHEFDKIFQMCKQEFKFTPKKVSYNPTLLTIKDKTAKTKLQNLISWGCVDKVGVLATAKKDTLGVLEFGDAVGFLTARVAELTHMPDPRYSPDLQEP